MVRTIKAMWDALTMPHSSVKRSDRRQVRFLSAFLLALSLFSIGGVFVMYSQDVRVEGELIFQRALIMPLLLFAAYFTSRTDLYRLAALITAFAVFSLSTGGALLATTPQAANAAL